MPRTVELFVIAGILLALFPSTYQFFIDGRVIETPAFNTLGAIILVKVFAPRSIFVTFSADDMFKPLKSRAVKLVQLLNIFPKFFAELEQEIFALVSLLHEINK